jgi:hypothetical protein
MAGVAITMTINVGVDFELGMVGLLSGFREVFGLEDMAKPPPGTLVTGTDCDLPTQGVAYEGWSDSFCRPGRLSFSGEEYPSSYGVLAFTLQN